MTTAPPAEAPVLRSCPTPGEPTEPKPMSFEEYKQLLMSIVPMVMVYAARKLRFKAVTSDQPRDVAVQVFTEMLARHQELQFGNPKRPDLSPRKAFYFMMKDRAGSIVKQLQSRERKTGEEIEVHRDPTPVIDPSEFIRTLEHAIEYAALLKKPHLRVFIELILWNPEKASLRLSGLSKFSYYDARETARGIVFPCLFDRQMNEARRRAHSDEDSDALSVLEAWDRGFIRPQDVADATGLPLSAIATAVKRILHRVHRVTGRD